MKIDLNCDLGESFGIYDIGNDDIIMDYVSSVNIACGFHAGDPEIMERTVDLAIEKGVSIGAHPGYPDLQGFGRRAMAMSDESLRSMIIYQVGALKAFVEIKGGRLNHVKPHGALYNLAARDILTARVIAKAIKDIDPDLILMGLAGSEMIKAAKEIGLPYANETFADRRYTDDMKLVPRSQIGAVIDQVEESVVQCVDMIINKRIMSINGEELTITGDSICIHGDNNHGIELVKALHQTFSDMAIKVEAVDAN